MILSLESMISVSIISQPPPPALLTLVQIPFEEMVAWNMSLQPFEVALITPNCAVPSNCPTTCTVPELSTAQSLAHSSPVPPANDVQVKLPLPSICAVKISASP